jgi:hypothetical protein
MSRLCLNPLPFLQSIGLQRGLVTRVWLRQSTTRLYSTGPENSTFEDWTHSDRYHNSFLIRRDAALENAIKNNRKLEFSQIAVSAAQGKFLKLLAISLGAKRILEVGTLGGYVHIR